MVATVSAGQKPAYRPRRYGYVELMRVYLDVCCLGRSSDDQSQPRIRAEAEAVKEILFLVRAGHIGLISSEALQLEVQKNPSLERRSRAESFLVLASRTVRVDTAITIRAGQLESLGYGAFDALHLASAESLLADVLLPTDDR